MNIILLKLLAILCIFAGESFSIYAEIVAAKAHIGGSLSFLPIFLKAFGVITLGGGLLVLGYMLGINALKNIWIIGVASIASIIIMEPTITWLIFREPPTTGAIIGLTLGFLGLLIATFF